MTETPKPIDPETLIRVYEQDLLTAHVTGLQVTAKKRRLGAMTNIMEWAEREQPKHNIINTIKLSAARLASEIGLLEEEKETASGLLGMIQAAAASEKIDLPVIVPETITPEIIEGVLITQATTNPNLRGLYPTAELYAATNLNQIIMFHPDYAQKR